MRILLDTNAFIHALNGSLPRKLERRLLKSNVQLLVSIITPWEIAIKPVLHLAGFNNTMVEDKVAEMGARLLSVTMEHTAKLYELPLYHKEPFDRMIIAQALVEQCPVVSSDQRFPLYESAGLKVLWDG